MTSETKLTDHLFRQQSGKMSSILINQFGFENAGLIEDIIQETFIAALKHWAVKGVPENPEGWLMQVAKNKFINEINRQKRHGKLNYSFVQSSDLEKLDETKDDDFVKQEQIKALFSCCSPLVSAKAQIMLTLKIISGFGDREIAKGLLMSEQAVRKAIYRAKDTLKSTNESRLEVSKEDYSSRLDIVLKALYLMFNEGYHTTSGDKLLDEDISFEAIRLTSWLLDALKVDHGKIHALMALMFFGFARFEARTNESNEILGIEHQDRSKWSRGLIQKGMYHQKKSRESNELSRYHIESGIAAEHCSSQNYQATNWSNIVSYYDRLLIFDSSMMVQINRAIAIAETGDSKKSLEILKQIEQENGESKSLLFGALARVYLLMRNYEMAKSYYKVALDLTKNSNEQRFYESKLSKILVSTEGLQN